MGRENEGVGMGKGGREMSKTELDEVCDWCPGELDECECQKMVYDEECPLFSDEEAER